MSAKAKKQDVTRRCIVTRASLGKDKMVRFVMGPEDEVVADIAEKLPGRGVWVEAQKETIETASKGAFSRAFKSPVNVSEDLSLMVEQGLVRTCLGILGLARRAGELVLGFDQVAAALKAPVLPSVFLEASDGARDGRTKLLKLLRAREMDKGASKKDTLLLGCFSGEELGLALGRENVVHGALSPGGLATRLKEESSRLAGFRELAPSDWGG